MNEPEPEAFSRHECGTTATFKLVNDKRSMSEMLLKQFSSVFSTPSANHAIHDIQSFFHDNDQIHSNLNTKLTDIIFTRESVEAAINP